MSELYHVTAKKNLPSISQKGLLSGSFWAIGDFAGELMAYYKETIEDEGDVPIVIKVFLDDLDKIFLKPDMPGLEEPIASVVGKSEEEIWHDWEDSKKSWKDCVEIIGSCKYNKNIPAELIYVDDNDNIIKLNDFVAGLVSAGSKLKHK